MTDQPDWIAEGWHSFKDEVLRKGWPDDPTFATLLEIAFFAGSGWTMRVIEDEGATPEVINGILNEWHAHNASVVERANKTMIESSEPKS